MHETVGSLRLLFSIAGGLGVIGAIAALFFDRSPVVLTFVLVGFVLTCAYLWTAKNIGRLLETAPWNVQRIILANLVWNAIVALIAAGRGNGFSLTSITGALFAWYLSVSVRQVARDIKDPKRSDG